MAAGSTFIAALIAILALQLIEPARPPVPYWHAVGAALIGAITVWVMTRIGTLLRKRRARAIFRKKRPRTI